MLRPPGMRNLSRSATAPWQNMQRAEKIDSRLNGIETMIGSGTTCSRFLAPGRCSLDWGTRCRVGSKRGLPRVQRWLWLKPQAANSVGGANHARLQSAADKSPLQAGLLQIDVAGQPF